MGTYSVWEFYEAFGGWPEPGEAHIDLAGADDLRKAMKEDAPYMDEGARPAEDEPPVIPRRGAAG